MRENEHPSSPQQQDAHGKRFAVERNGHAAPPPHDPAAVLAARMAEGLERLERAWQSALDVDCDPWEFAVEIQDLRSVGLTFSDLRWLIRKGYVEHAHEVTLPGEEARAFHRARGISFTRRTCLVLTPEGAQAVRETAAAQPLPPRTTATVLPPAAPERRQSLPPQPVEIPHWDADLMELRYAGQLVKQFKVPAPNQEMILAAFEEEGWPARIDDPLPPVRDQDPKRRLHDTINSLNRNQKQPLLRFLGDGSGQGVRWTVMEDSAECGMRSAE